MNNERNETGRTPIILALDTSTASMTAAVLEGTRLLGERWLHVERNHSMYLIPEVQELLAEICLRPNDIGAYVVGWGPGSYTGVRIGVTVAKTMAWSLGRPVVGVSSLETLALGAVLDGMEGGSDEASEQSGLTWIVPLMDARRKQAYTALFACDGGISAESGIPLGWRRLKQDGIRLLEPWFGQLTELLEATEPEARPHRIVFTGETEGFKDALAATGEMGLAYSVNVQPFALRSGPAGLLGLARLRAGDTDDVHRLVPNYTQLAEAEAKLLAKQRG